MAGDLQPPPALRASYPVRRENDVRILIDGEEAFDRILAAATAATESLWITVSFTDIDIVIPPFESPVLDRLEQIAETGVDVRLLFWWSEFAGIGSFRGDDHEIEMLRKRVAKIKMRWDHIVRGCHHQKSYVVDGQVAFVGGINLNEEALSSQRHDSFGYHDVFAEVRGPSASDVAHNFIERWNQATETLGRGHAYPSRDVAENLNDVLTVARAHTGDSTVQVVRTISAGLYSGDYGWTGRDTYRLRDGEFSIQESVHGWIKAARHSIYLENQFVMDPETIAALETAAGRGVDITCVVPLEPDPNLLLYPEKELRKTREALARLADNPRFGMFGLRHAVPPYQPIYVHAKFMVVDDAALMVGSANLWPPSYNRDSELNLCVWNRSLARETRLRLQREHLQTGNAATLNDWRACAVSDVRRRQSGQRAASRLELISPASYYDFPSSLQAPWEHLRHSDR